MSQGNGNNDGPRKGYEAPSFKGKGSVSYSQQNVSAGDEPSTPVDPHSPRSTVTEPSSSPRSEASRPPTRDDGTAQSGAEVFNSIGGIVQPGDANVSRPPKRIKIEQPTSTGSDTDQNHEHRKNDRNAERGNKRDKDDNAEGKTASAK